MSEIGPQAPRGWTLVKCPCPRMLCPGTMRFPVSQSPNGAQDAAACWRGGGRLLVAREPVGRKRPGDKSFSTVELPGAVGGPAAWRRPARDPAPGLQACCVGALLCGTSSVPGDVSGSRRQPPRLAPPRVWACGAPSCRLASPAPLSVPPVMSVPKLTEPGLPLAPKGAGPLGGAGPSSPEPWACPPPAGRPVTASVGDSARPGATFWDSGTRGRATAGQQGCLGLVLGLGSWASSALDGRCHTA